MVRAARRCLLTVAAATVVAGIGCREDSTSPPRDPGQPSFHLGDEKPIRVTGTGRIDYPPGSAQKNPSSSKLYQEFGLTVGDKNLDGVPDGKLVFVDYTPAHRINGAPLTLESVSWSTYGRTTDGCLDAGIDATGTLKVKNNGLQYRFHLYACDNGEPGTALPRDIFYLDVYNADGSLRWIWRAVLTGGNLQAHFDDVTVTTGNLTVATNTTGSSLDPDGYTVTIDGGLTRTVPTTGSTTYMGLPAGDHSVQLSGVATNCTVSGSNPRTVTVIAGNSVTTTFDVTCSTPTTTGNLTVSTSTSGSSLDPDGYTVTVDGGQSRTIPITGSTTYTGLAAGDHSVELTGVATTCTVGGANPRTVTVLAGGTVSTTFTVTCSTPTTTGSLTVSTSTSGSSIDPDGYTVTVDGGQSRTIAVTGSTTYTELAAGDHSVALTGVATNCIVGGANPRTVTVRAGETVTTTFTVTCSTPTAVVRITGLGQIGTGAPAKSNNVQTFDFDVASDLTGRFFYTDWGVIRPDGSVATATVDPADPTTGIATFTASSTFCADPSRGVFFTGTVRLDTGERVGFEAAACDNGPAGSGLDFFRFAVPTHGGYARNDFLTSGDIAKSGP